MNSKLNNTHYTTALIIIIIIGTCKVSHCFVYKQSSAANPPSPSILFVCYVTPTIQENL